jgi:mannitol-specific phosphotransferase system IIBC component
MKNITLPSAIVIGCCIVAVAVISSQLLKQSAIERQQETRAAAERAEAYKSEQEKQETAIIESTNVQKIEGQRKDCLLSALESWKANLQIVENMQVSCEQYSIYTKPGQDCIKFAADTFDEYKLDYETEQQQCYDRFPTTN